MGQAPRQPPGDCRFTQKLGSYPVFTSAFASCRVAGPGGVSLWESIWLWALPMGLGDLGRCRKPEEETLKICFPPWEGGLSVCAPARKPKGQGPQLPL